MDARVDHRTDVELGGAPEGLDALIVAERLKAAGGVGLFVARDYQRAGAFTQTFGFFAQDVEVLDYPAWDCLPYDRASPSRESMGRRMAVFEQLARDAAGSVVAASRLSSHAWCLPRVS